MAVCESMKENYQAWQIDPDSFPKSGNLRDQLLFLLRFAVLAPSGHNSQPWEFSLHENTISVWVKRERSLAGSDPQGRQLLIGMGCMIENLCVAADYYGFKSVVRYFPHSQNEDLIANITFAKNSEIKNNPQHLIFSIPKRHTNRNRYETHMPPQDFLDAFLKLSNADMQISLVSEQRLMERIADIANTAGREIMDSITFRKELSEYVKSNYTKSKVGMPAAGMGIPGPISLITSWLIRKMNMARKTAKKDDMLLKKYTPSFVVVSTKGDGNEERLEAGRHMERIWLMATQRGLNCAPLAAPVQVGEYHKQLQSLLGISARPLVFLRVGYCDKRATRSPRLSVQEVLQ